MILDDAQIEAQMQELINAIWPPTKRERAIRTGVLLDELNAFFAGMSAVKEQKIADRDFQRQVVAYQAAVAFLAKPALELSDVIAQEQVDANIIEREAAQLLVDSATAEVIAAGATELSTLLQF